MSTCQPPDVDKHSRVESDHTPSADLDLATRGIVFAAGTAGQRCTSMCRIIGHQDIADELTDRISQVYRRLPIGHPFADPTFVGPLFDGRSHADMTEALGHAVAQDGQVLVGRHRDSAATTRPAPRSAVHSAARSHRRRPRIRLRRVARLHAPRHEHRQLLA